jgi:hypothetical protein
MMERQSRRVGGELKNMLAPRTSDIASREFAIGSLASMLLIGLFGAAAPARHCSIAANVCSGTISTSDSARDQRDLAANFEIRNFVVRIARMFWKAATGSACGSNTIDKIRSARNLIIGNLLKREEKTRTRQIFPHKTFADVGCDVHMHAHRYSEQRGPNGNDTEMHDNILPTRTAQVWKFNLNNSITINSVLDFSTPSVSKISTRASYDRSVVDRPLLERKPFANGPLNPNTRRGRVARINA